MNDFKILKISAEHVIKSRGTALLDPATSNFDARVTPEAIYALACAHEQAASDLHYTQKSLDEAMAAVERLKAENEALRKDRTDWQAECLKKGFEYVRESDDHYVLADVPEMADLLGALLGVEVRSKENDSYEEANSRLNEQVEGLINTIHAQESMRKDAERWRFIRNPIGNSSSFAIWSEQKNLFLGKNADEAIDAAMSKEPKA